MGPHIEHICTLTNNTKFHASCVKCMSGASAVCLCCISGVLKASPTISEAALVKPRSHCSTRTNLRQMSLTAAGQSAVHFCFKLIQLQCMRMQLNARTEGTQVAVSAAIIIPAVQKELHSCRILSTPPLPDPALGYFETDGRIDIASQLIKKKTIFFPT